MMGAGCSSEVPGAASAVDGLAAVESTVPLGEGESLLTLVGTNDIHGNFARMPIFGGYLHALRTHHSEAYGARNTMLLLDAGDAVQGTLASNFSEGTVAIRLMNALGYTAAIAGNHGFDFGPVDWTRDQCDARTASCDPLGALRRYVQNARFPFLGANVTERATGKNLKDLPPYVLVPHQGRNVAVFGLENHFTDRTTVPENVAHLAFDDGIEVLQRTIDRMWANSEADAFVAIAHEGDGADGARPMRDWLSRLPRRSDGAPLLDAVIAGHTHLVNDDVAGDVPYVQSGANGEKFGLIELVMTKRADGRLDVARARTRRQAAIAIESAAESFMGQPLAADAHVAALVADATQNVSNLANEPLASTNGLSRDAAMAVAWQIRRLETSLRTRCVTRRPLPSRSSTLATFAMA
jgi:2',3'-cyclic-nucleotide 2'-phosphodiesterase (5'-nucleotidase family)